MVSEYKSVEFSLRKRSKCLSTEENNEKKSKKKNLDSPSDRGRYQPVDLKLAMFVCLFVTLFYFCNTLFILTKRSEAKQVSEVNKQLAA